MLCSIILCFSIITLTKTCFAQGTGFIYIRIDGSIDPPTAPISTIDNVTYTLTDDIINASIMIERDDVSIDGANHSVQGPGLGSGIALSGRNNVTIKNFEIRDFYRGFYAVNSQNNSIIRNNITNNAYGIFLGGSGNIIIENSFTNDGLFVYYSYAGAPVNIVHNNTVNGKPLIYLENVSGYEVADAGQVILVGCSNITVENLDTYNSTVGVELYRTNNSQVMNNNIMSNSQYGICLFESSNNNDVSANSITGSDVGIYSDSSSYNRISANGVSNSTRYGIFASLSSHSNFIGNRIEINGDYGIYLANSYFANVTENNVTGNIKGGIFLGFSHDNYVFGNNLTSNAVGISLKDTCRYNTISENNVENNGIGVNLHNSPSNNIIANNVADSNYGISILESSDNRIYYNNFVNNTNQVYDYSWNNTGYVQSINIWDFFYPSYPSGGNYWSNYNGTDLHSGSYQNETGSDGLGDTPYIIDANNTDHYPLMVQYVIPEFPTFLVLSLFMIATLLAIVVYKRRILSRAL